MDAKELRVGNLIADYEVNEGYFAIEEIKKNEQGNLAVYYRNGSCMSIEPEPIPITEEWLLKFGFEKKDKIFYIKDFFVDSEDNSFNLKEGIGVFLIDVFYIHQLQNLYFALTNEELTIKN